MVQSSLLLALSALLSAQFALAAPSVLQARAQVSPDGSCSGPSGNTCQGSNFGNSCGRNNRCGNSADYSFSKLSQGCQPDFGFCVAKGSVSPDGSCSGFDGFICIGSNFGDSCGRYNLCGRDAGYSGDGCQPNFGFCQKCTTTVLPSTKTSTVLVTKTNTVTLTTSKTTTINGGRATTTKLTTSTVTVSGTLITTKKVTVTPAVVSTTSTRTVTTTLSGGTVTVTSTAGSGFEKRDAPEFITAPAAEITPTEPAPPQRQPLAKLARRAPGDPAGLSCGTIITTGATTTTQIISSTVTKSESKTITVTRSTTIPGATVTSTRTILTTKTSNQKSTVTQTITKAAVTRTFTGTVTATSTGPAATVTVTQPLTVYKKVAEVLTPNTCTYSRFYERFGASIDPADNYKAARDECAGLCNDSADCVSFFFARFNQDGEFTECLLDSLPYDAALLDCNVSGETLYYAAYDEVVSAP